MSKLFPVQVKRKSYEKIEPQMPYKSKSIRDSNSGKRTNYKQINVPEQRLKEFKRRQIGQYKTDNTLNSIQQKQYQLTKANCNPKQQINPKHSISEKYLNKQSKDLILPSKSAMSVHSKSPQFGDNSITKTQPNAYSPLKSTHNASKNYIQETPFREDHYNTQSLAQLMKNGEKVGLMTSRRGLEQQTDIINPKKESLGISDELESQKQNGKQQKEESEFDGFLPGQKAQEDQYEASNVKRKQPKIKKYQKQIVSQAQRVDPRLVPCSYQPKNESQRRMEKQYWDSQKRNFITKHEDQQMLRMMQQFQRNKKQLRMNNNKKVEMVRSLKMTKVVGSFDKKYNPETEEFDPRTGIPVKSLSLPFLKAKREIIIPVDDVTKQRELKKQIQANPYANFIQNKTQEIRIMNSLSLSKFTIAKKKKMRTMCDVQMMAQNELKQMELAASLLREKKILFNPKSLRQGLINVRNVPIYSQNENIFPSKQLPSNPIYKKFPL